jgi:hypothetical protein
MLKSHQTDEPEALSTASQTRVTPEELAQALAAIETRKQAEANRLAGTILIHQAVAELNLDSTPEEILAEVQAQRAKAAAAQREQMRREQETHREQEIQQRFIAPRTKRRRGWTGFIVPMLALWVLAHNGLIPHFGSHMTHAAVPVVRPLIQVPDGQEVYADDSALVQLSKGKSPSQITVSTNATGNRWTLVKIGGHVYLRGYIADTDSLLPLRGNALHIYNDANSGELEGIKTSHITLRVDSIQLDKSGGDHDFSEITVPNFQPDALTTLSPWH